MISELIVLKTSHLPSGEVEKCTSHFSGGENVATRGQSTCVTALPARNRKCDFARTLLLLAPAGEVG
jgi:hypothetical protein